MDDFNTAILEAIEQAGIAGLCREGQLEIAVQEVRRGQPGLSDNESLALAEAMLALSKGSV